ncbi:MAG TPA: MBL fold metallo-hydrolase [Afifellaceae bacterium]|nr:MBL fold metallo-hydrolase [Afifellaceae bacterium]
MTKVRTSPSRGPASPEVTGFYEPDTGSIQYVVSDPGSGRAAIVDAVWNFDPAHARTSTEAADEILRHVGDRGLQVEWILDTHPHADHFMAAAYLKERLGAPIAIGEKVRDIAALWAALYHLSGGFDVDAIFDRLFADGDSFNIGGLEVRVMLSPGHTLGSVTYVVGEDAAFVHDTLMYPDSGTSRADFPGGDAATLYRSIQAILALPGETRLFVGHDYCNGGREPLWEATVAEHRATNVHLKDGTDEAAYVKLRTERDRTLPLPDRMLHALQVNLRGGRLPEPEADGHCYFKIPANRF